MLASPRADALPAGGAAYAGAPLAVAVRRRARLRPRPAGEAAGRRRPARHQRARRLRRQPPGGRRARGGARRRRSRPGALPRLPAVRRGAAPVRAARQAAPHALPADQPEAVGRVLRRRGVLPDDGARPAAPPRPGSTRATAASLEACVRCNLCAESCHVFLSDREPRPRPPPRCSRWRGSIAATTPGPAALLPGLTGARALDDAGARGAGGERRSAAARCAGAARSNCAVGPRSRRPRSASAARWSSPRAWCPRASGQRHRRARDRQQHAHRRRRRAGDDRLARGGPARHHRRPDASRCRSTSAAPRVLYALNPREIKFFPLSISAAGQLFHAAARELDPEQHRLRHHQLRLLRGRPRRRARRSRRPSRARPRPLGVADAGRGRVRARLPEPEVGGARVSAAGPCRSRSGASSRCWTSYLTGGPHPARPVAATRRG